MSAYDLKNIVLITFAGVGGFISSLLGGWDKLLCTLIVCMVIDYITGFLLAFVFHKSSKTKNGCASSEAGFKGIVKKICIMCLVALCVCIDSVTGTEYIRNTALLFFIGNEGLSIIENTDKMGVPYPEFIKKALEAIKEHNSKEHEDE